MSNTIVSQSIPTIVNYTLQELLDMPSTLNGEQFPLNPNAVDKLEGAIYADGLLQIIEVTKFNDTVVLTGGRHRREALANLYSNVDPCDVSLAVLQYTVSSPDELALRVTSSNGSRRMVSAETKELEVASKFGFDLVTAESLIDKIHTMDDLYTFVLALALKLNNAFDFGKKTSLVVARSLTTKLKTLKVTLINDALVDTDGTQLAPATKTKVSLLAHTFSSGSDSIDYLLDSVVNSIDYLAVTPHAIPLTVYTDALTLGMVGELTCQMGYKLHQS